MGLGEVGLVEGGGVLGESGVGWGSREASGR